MAVGQAVSPRAQRQVEECGGRCEDPVHQLVADPVPLEVEEADSLARLRMAMRAGAELLVAERKDEQGQRMSFYSAEVSPRRLLSVVEQDAGGARMRSQERCQTSPMTSREHCARFPQEETRLFFFGPRAHTKAVHTSLIATTASSPAARLTVGTSNEAMAFFFVLLDCVAATTADDVARTRGRGTLEAAKRVDAEGAKRPRRCLLQCVLAL